jgi:hypothetical protein
MVQLATCGDPVVDNLVILRIEGKSLTPLMRYCTCGFQKHQGVICVGEIHSPASMVIGEGSHIEDRVIAS